MSMLPNFNDIAYFLEIAETGNISRAAERLGITQPSLSSAVKRLEDSVATKLLIRSQKGVQLTKAGLELVAHGRSLLNQWSQIQGQVSERSTSVTGKYVIGVHPSVASYTLPNFLPELMKQHPDLNIQLVHDLSRKITESVISHSVDFGIVVNPIKHPDLVIRRLCHDEVGFWVLAAVKKKKTFIINQQPLIFDPSLTQSQDLLAKISKQGVSFQRQIHSSNLSVVRDLVAAGAGVGILPSRVAQTHKQDRLQLLSSDAPIFKDTICLIYRADTPRTLSREVITKAISQKVPGTKW